MLSSTLNTHHKPLFLSNPTKHFSTSFIPSQPLHKHPLKPSQKPSSLSISATLIPSSSKQQVYQPFRPPPSPVAPQFKNLDANARLEVLANRLGRWFEYAPLIPSLIAEGFTPPSIEEATGISGVEQNRLVVAAQVRDSMVQSNTDPEIVAAFDSSGAEILYEIRLLSAKQRSAAARFIIENEMDAKGAQDLARSIKDYPRRRGDKGWESFDYNLAGDCLAFMCYRQSREHKNPSEPRTSALNSALKYAESEKAKNEVLRELQGEKEKEEEEEIMESVRVPVVRLRFGEVAEATNVVVLPVCRSEGIDRELLDAPFECRSEGEFGVVVAERGWNRWVVLPRWEPVATLGIGGVVVSFPDARVLPWSVNKWYKEESILVVADRARKEVSEEDGFYLVAHDGGGDGRSGGVKVERGTTLIEKGLKESLGTVVLVVRPPRDEVDDQLGDEDWL